MADSMNVNKIAATLFGAVFVLVGVLGFVTPLAPDGDLLGLFAVNLLHNIVHLGTGVGLLVFASIDEGRKARTGLLVFGAVYGLVTVLGFIAMDLVNMLGIAMNVADNFLHVILTIALLGVPLAFKDGASDARAVGR